MKLSYVTANLIGEASGFSGDTNWGKLHDEMVKRTTPESFRKIARKVKSMGFDGIEVYTGHCCYTTHGPDFGKAIREVCEDEGLAIAGYAGGFGQPDGAAEDYRRTFAMCKALGASVMAGMPVGDDWTLAAEMLRDEGLIIGYENHPDKTAEEVLAKLDGNQDVIKATLDTGNLTVRGGDAADAVKKLYPVLVHLHFKDVKAVGAHDTLAVGKGVAKVKEVVDYCKARGYSGWASIEHEPFDRDPDPEVAESLETVRSWLGD